MKNYALLLSMGTLALIVSCSSNSTQVKIEKYQATSPVVIDTVYTNEYVAEINALQNVEIRNRISGFVEAIFVDEGQSVQKGQLLFSISSKIYQQELQKAKANTKNALAELKLAEIELENAKLLLRKSIIAKPEYEAVAAKVESMQAKVEEAQANEAQASLSISFAEIKAPFDGIINRIPNKEGSWVEEGTLLTSISNNQEVFAYFNVSENDYLDYALAKDEGKPKEVSLLLSNGSNYHYKGKIETTESEFDKSTGNIAFRAKFPNPDNLLKHGASGKVQVNHRLKNAMLIPQKSTFEIQGNTYVFVIENNMVEMRKVVVEYSLPQLYVVRSGLSANDKFIYEGIQKVKEGDKIEAEWMSFINY